MAELGNLPADPQLMHLLGQVHQALPRYDGRKHQVVDVMLATCASHFTFSNLTNFVDSVPYGAVPTELDEQIICNQCPDSRQIEPGLLALFALNL